MIRSSKGHWEILLADLSLILFIVALGGLVSSNSVQGATAPQTLTVAPSQALYRQIAGGPTLGEWLVTQSRDPRATLTIFVDYRFGQEDESWQNAAAMIAAAKSEGVGVRTVLRPADRADIHASLAFDSAI